MVRGKFKIDGTIDSQGMVTRTETWEDNPVLGDMPVETIYTGYKDFGGVKFPTKIVQKQGGYMVLELDRHRCPLPMCPSDLPVPETTVRLLP